ncbi:MAG: UDP-N-acetylmuramoyl-L-alanine--D-glutamate ligase [Lentisphaeria bacterium]|nr:UDP-N-acetylmuramoyl-L-alanine--D-glutamate ligase [Lentisphaeria bacterium]
MNDLSGFRILVLGAGRSGCAAARLARAHGAEVKVLDSAPQEKLASVQENLAREGIVLECGCTSESWEGPEIFQVVVSPGIALDSPLHRLGESTGAPLVGELEFGASFLHCPFYAVTGTNGKTTTTELLTACLKAAGRKVLAAGNIGLPLSQVALDAPELDALVVEVSSFQMEHAASFRPVVAILLNVTPDHLNRHGSLEKYRECKCRLLEQVPSGGHVVYHSALEMFLNIAPDVSRSRLWLRGETPETTGRPEAKEWLVEADGLRVLDADGAAEGTLLMPRSRFQLQGSHNLANALAVVAALDAMGIPLDSYRGALSDFRSGPHRIQTIATRKGVQYVDDSKATDVDAMIQALRTLGPVAGKKLHLIAGGLDKGCALGEVKTELRMYVKDVYLIGACRQRLAVEWGDQVPCRQCQSLEEAVALAAEQSEPGDTVLLSPGCASMDMFRSYEERGERFAAAVSALPGESS